MHSFYLLRHIRASSWIEHSNFCRFKWRWKSFSCDTVSRLALIMLFDRRTYKVFGLSGRHGRWSRKPPTWAQNSGNVFITQQSVTHPKKHLFYTSVPPPSFFISLAQFSFSAHCHHMYISTVLYHRRCLFYFSSRIFFPCSFRFLGRSFPMHHSRLRCCLPTFLVFARLILNNNVYSRVRLCYLF